MGYFETFKIIKSYASSNPKVKKLSEEELRLTQQVLLEILKDFDNICKKHHLTYYLTGGSALGAVRHAGFIPWDDDADVSMPRSDFEQFKEIALEELNKKYYIESLDTSLSYDLNFIKLRKRGTKFVEIFDADIENAGISLDIYPLDDCYNSKALQLVNGLIDEGLYFIASCVRMYQKKDKLLKCLPNEQIQKVLFLKCLIGRLFDSKQNPRKWYYLCERWSKKYKNKNSKYVATSCGRGHFFGEIYERNRLFPTVDTLFEDMNFQVPKDSDYLLSKLYGENYLLPPQNREAHSLLIFECGEQKKETESF